MIILHPLTQFIPFMSLWNFELMILGSPQFTSNVPRMNVMKQGLIQMQFNKLRRWVIKLNNTFIPVDSRTRHLPEANVREASSSRPVAA